MGPTFRSCAVAQHHCTTLGPRRDNNQRVYAFPWTYRRGCTSWGHLRHLKRTCGPLPRDWCHQGQRSPTVFGTWNHVAFHAPAGNGLRIRQFKYVVDDKETYLMARCRSSHNSHICEPTVVIVWLRDCLVHFNLPRFTEMEWILLSAMAVWTFVPCHTSFDNLRTF